ncbi:MAG TPA: hypothetical protein VFN21_01710 [Acidimicrobiales bacterium]|nr:hypothetical protein [Acidimicrobiales bacterium]
MNGPTERTVAQVTVTAPVRIADVGGWTDTWFARTGAVCHLGVGPGVTVHAALHDGAPGGRPVRLIAPDLDEDYPIGPSPSTGWDDPEPGRHPLLEHAVASVCRRFAPAGPVTVMISSAVPPGASLGTSASVVVAVITALEALAADDTDPTRDTTLSDSDRKRIAQAAHRVETIAAGRESGVQDQHAAAFGGAQLIEMIEYPMSRRTPIDVDDTFRTRLNEATVTVVLGAHDSSSVHAAVIEAIITESPAGIRRRAALDDLRDLAEQAAVALRAADLEAWAVTLTEATRAQQRLHDDLIGPGHRAVIELARTCGARGWKVNGAGGDGGSVTMVFADPSDGARFTDRVDARHPAWTAHHLGLHPGVEVRRGPWSHALV